ncbi:MAG: ferrous iron transport protein B, partial [Bacillota bacterium]
AVLFGIVNASSAEGMQEFAAVLSSIGFGQLNAFCLMVFCLLYIPCAATLATIHKESKSWKWTGFVALFQLAVAWLITFVIYQIGCLFV